jgi:hypothetical protein
MQCDQLSDDRSAAAINELLAALAPVHAKWFALFIFT